MLLNKPIKIQIEAFDADGKKLMSGPSPEHVDPNKDGGDPFQDDPRVLPAFNGSSPSGDVTGDVVYANYGTLADFKKLAALGISVKDKIVLVRYGGNYRGVKVYIAQQYGAKGVLIYSDPADDGYFQGDMYPKGPYRPDSAVQRGAVQFLPIYPGDPETPGIASTLDLPDSKRIPQDKLQDNQPSIPANPLSYKDAAPILEALGGQQSPHDWQGALPFTYHLGGAGTRLRPHAPRAGHPPAHHLGCHWNHRRHRSRAEGQLGRRRQPSRRLGLRRGRSQLRHRRHARVRPRPRRAAQAGLEAQAPHRRLLLGRRRGGPHRLHRVGRAA